jgi:hypothetical protein
VVERLESLGFPEVLGPSTRGFWDGHYILKEGMPGKGRGPGEWVSGCFNASPWRTMDGFGHGAKGWIGAASIHHRANWQAGAQAGRQIVRYAAGWRVKFGIVP